jgi:hypothetical protein
MTRCQCEALAVVPSCCADDAADVRALSPEAVKVDEAASHLESPNRRVVLVLYNDRASKTPRQERPSVLWS